MVVKKPSYDCAIQIKSMMPCISNKNKPVTNFRNQEGWQRNKIISYIYAPRMKEVVENIEDVNDLRIRIHIVNLDIQIESFSITWEGPRTQKKKRDSKELNQLFREQNEEMDKLL